MITVAIWYSVFVALGSEIMPATVAQSVARNDIAVKLDAEVAKMAKHIAIDRKITLAEYLSERLRPLVEQDFRKMADKFRRKEEGGKP